MDLFNEKKFEDEDSNSSETVINYRLNRKNGKCDIVLEGSPFEMLPALNLIIFKIAKKINCTPVLILQVLMENEKFVSYFMSQNTNDDFFTGETIINEEQITSILKDLVKDIEESD